MKINKKALKQIIAFLLSLIFVGIVIIIDINSKKEEPIIEEEIKEAIPYLDYDWNNLSGNMYLKYEDDKYTSAFGIDVAAHQDTIDWKKVKNKGIEFAYIRLGYRGATTGLLHMDEEFENNYKGAKENDIKVGIYWYAQPISKEESLQEANYVLDKIEDLELDLPIVYDFEETMLYDETSRMHGMTKQNRTTMAVTFLEEIKKHGYDTMIYTNLDWSQNYYDWSRLHYPIWFAQYDVDYPTYDRPFVMWQYTDEGYVDGIIRDVDLDLMLIRKNDQN